MRRSIRDELQAPQKILINRCSFTDNASTGNNAGFEYGNGSSFSRNETFFQEMRLLSAAMAVHVQDMESIFKI